MTDFPYAADAFAVRDRTPAAIKADNIIRQRLRIGDPRNPSEVALGLKRLFPSEARLLDSEAEGLPTLPTRMTTLAIRAPESAATGAELNQGIADVERDLLALTTDHRLKGITAELQGWAQAIRSLVADGMAAARLSLDPRARDRLFAARRQLGDYARLARLIGALTQSMNSSYRRLAQSLDQVAGLILVLAGEALAGAGLGGGRFLLSVPASELQARRDAVLLALQTVTGTTDQAFGNNQWPWGLHGLREILRHIEASGHLELRALLDEPVLGKLMDELIERASQQSVSGLRALGATADIAVQRLYRLLQIINDRVQPESPAIMSFLKAIQLFLDAFGASRSGYRLLFVARAPIAFNGLGGSGGPDMATARLIELVIRRGRLAAMLDCFGCGCCDEDVICQVILDKILYDTDRAIDLYTLGSDPDGQGEPEWRAAAFSVLIWEFLEGHATPPSMPFTTTTVARKRWAECIDTGCFAAAAELKPVLKAIRDTLAVGTYGSPAGMGGVPQMQKDWMLEELCLQRLSDRRLEPVIATLSSGCITGETVLAWIGSLLTAASNRIQDGHVCLDLEIEPPPTIEESLEVLNRLKF